MELQIYNNLAMQVFVERYKKNVETPLDVKIFVRVTGSKFFDLMGPFNAYTTIPIIALVRQIRWPLKRDV